MYGVLQADLEDAMQKVQQEVESKVVDGAVEGVAKRVEGLEAALAESIPKALEELRGHVDEVAKGVEEGRKERATIETVVAERVVAQLGESEVLVALAGKVERHRERLKELEGNAARTKELESQLKSAVSVTEPLAGLGGVGVVERLEALALLEEKVVSGASEQAAKMEAMQQDVESKLEELRGAAAAGAAGGSVEGLEKRVEGLEAALAEMDQAHTPWAQVQHSMSLMLVRERVWFVWCGVVCHG